ncbi:MAG: histidine phosphatase family protein [Deltaproteobacteria bacterium]|nr:histidine phosphatase family protein [Deltaproteobacteria bacterium]
MSTLEVCLVRHGQSVSNAAGVWQGQGDSPLSEIGRTQVDGLGQALAGERYDLVLSSDLSRAADTAKASGVEVEHDRAWREIHVGDWEGLTMEQVARAGRRCFSEPMHRWPPFGVGCPTAAEPSFSPTAASSPLSSRGCLASGTSSPGHSGACATPAGPPSGSPKTKSSSSRTTTTPTSRATSARNTSPARTKFSSE